MNVIDLLVTIVVVTILVTIVLAIVTYIAYKLRLAREPSNPGDRRGPRYFVRYDPPAGEARGTHAGSATAATPADPSRHAQPRRTHAAEA